MAGLFPRRTSADNKLGGIRVQESVYGKSIPIPYGTNRLTGNLLWYSDFIARPVKNKGGKGGWFGGGGKGGSQQYDYGAAVAIALCEGPIDGIDAVWDTQGTLPVNYTSENYTVGGSGIYTVTHSPQFLNDKGVTRGDPYSITANDYGSPGSVVISGTNQTPMTPGSTLAGHYTESGGTYHFSSSDAGKVMTIRYTYRASYASGSDPIHSLNLSLFKGTQGQAPWGFIASKYPAQSIGYSLLAYVANELLDLGSSGVLPNLSFEIQGLLRYGGGLDCDPRDVIFDIMTNNLRGCGIGIGEVTALTAYSNYCLANGLLISPFLDEDRKASDWIDEILKATNSEIVRNGFLLDIVPYGDTTIVGNGVEYIPATEPLYSLNDDDYLFQSGDTPVKLERPTEVDAYNVVEIEWTDRSNNYNMGVTRAEDTWAVAKYGYRPEGSRSYHFFTTPTAAQAAVQTALSRLIYIRNKIRFQAPATYILPDPMEVLELNDPALPSADYPVRIISISEDKDKNLEFECEQFPWGCNGPTLYPKQGASRPSPNASADPGDVNYPIVFEAVSRLRGSDPNQELWMGLSGSSPDWGGCRIWMSLDNLEYLPVGTIKGGSVMGLTTADWPAAADPDTTNDLSIDLTESLGNLENFSNAQEDGFASLFYVGGGYGAIPYELGAYGSAVLTAANKYTLKATGTGNRLRRNVFGTPNAPSGGVDHPSGSPWLFLNGPVFTVSLDPSFVGKTIYLKFTSFNLRSASEQNTADVATYTFTPTGLLLGLYGYGYSIQPTNILTQDATVTTLDIAPFTIISPAGAAKYLGTSIPGLSSTATLYAYVYDPNFLGENATLGVACRYAALTTPAYSGVAGWFYLGQITMLAGGGATQGGPGGGIPGGGGTPGGSYTSVTAENDGTFTGTTLSTNTVHAPIVPGTMRGTWGTLGIVDFDNGNGTGTFELGPHGAAGYGTVTYATGSYTLTSTIGSISGTVTMNYQYT